MKVLHIMTTDVGGAANAGLHLHQGLLELGIESNVLSMIKTKDRENVFKYEVSFIERAKRILKKKGIIRNSLYNLKKTYYSSKSNIIFSFPFSYLDICTSQLYKDADIINLHWVAGFINYPSFFAHNNKPCIWTLHDMNPFMGGVHYEGDLDASIQNLEEELKTIKKGCLSNYKNLNIVAPSSWLMNRSINSDLFKTYEHLCIPYGIDLSVFKPYNKYEVKRKYNIDPNKPLLLFVSENVNNYRKGFDLLTGAINELKERDILLGIVGSTDKNLNIENSYYFGKIKDSKIMAEIYSAADAFIIPSREDNLPNTMLESIACGTPVLGFAVGGMLDVIQNGFNGYLANDISSQSLAKKIELFLNTLDQFDSNKIREFAIKKFSLHKQAACYINLYNKLLHNSKTSFR